MVLRNGITGSLHEAKSACRYVSLFFNLRGSAELPETLQVRPSFPPSWHKWDCGWDRFSEREGKYGI